MKVLLDLNRPLLSGTQIRTKECLAQWIDFKYEHLLSFFTDCEKLGHESRGCEDEVEQENTFGPWLKAENKFKCLLRARRRLEHVGRLGNHCPL